MFGIALTTIGTHAAAFVVGGGLTAWASKTWAKVKADIQSEEASIKARLAALEAVAKPTPTPPAA